MTYSMGLRLGETPGLTVADIEPRRLLVDVARGDTRDLIYRLSERLAQALPAARR